VQLTWLAEAGCKLETYQREPVSFCVTLKLIMPQLSRGPLGSTKKYYNAINNSNISLDLSHTTNVWAMLWTDKIG
jgi:hypothetical protein